MIVVIVLVIAALVLAAWFHITAVGEDFFRRLEELLIEFFLALSAGLLCLAAGFFLGVAYGVQQEQRANTERQRMLRSLKQMEDRRAI